jgi:hypothetical protein
MNNCYRLVSVILATVLALASLSVLAQAPSSPAVELHSLDVSDQLDLIRSKIVNSVPIQDVTITGRMVWDRNAIVARQLIFAPGAELVFSRRALEKGPELFVICASLISQDPQRPGQITWEKSDPSPPPAPADSAAQGQNGIGDGAAGLPGLSGALGAPGVPGADAPSVYLFVSHLSGSPVAVRIDGGPGGDGGPGQVGGGGGAGSRGDSASQSAFDCKRGPGYGGSGGLGGNGGAGGAGGVGGRGGLLTVLSVAPSLQGIRLLASGGAGGHGGIGGRGGSGGLGGPEGSAQLPWCRPSGRQGSPGATGKDGATAPDGARGLDGQVRFVRLSDELQQRIAGDLDTRKCTWFGLVCR